MHDPLRSRLLSLSALVLLLPSRMLAAEAKETPGQKFLRVFRAADSTAEQRRGAWEELRAGDEAVSKSVAKAIDARRRLAWKGLQSLIASSAVRKAASGLRRRVQPHQAKAKGVVHGEGFSKETLDEAMKPIDEALDKAVEALHGAKGYEERFALVDELETYAAGAGLRVGWDSELGETLVTLQLVARYAGGQSTLEVVAHNARAGEFIGPGEYACVARLNTHRLLLGIRPAEIDLRLVLAAKKHSEEMAAKRYFAHESPTAHLSTPWKRAAREHTSSQGECIAGGQRSGLGAFRGWYYSQGHHRIMINGSAAIGVGRSGSIWTLMTGNSLLRGAIASKYTVYVRGRYRVGEEADRLYKLARWCATSGLKNQAIDELERILILDPDHGQARRALDAMLGRKPTTKDPDGKSEKSATEKRPPRKRKPDIPWIPPIPPL